MQELSVGSLGLGAVPVACCEGLCVAEPPAPCEEVTMCQAPEMLPPFSEPCGSLSPDLEWI